MKELMISLRTVAFTFSRQGKKKIILQIKHDTRLCGRKKRRRKNKKGKKEGNRKKSGRENKRKRKRKTRRSYLLLMMNSDRA